MADFGLQVLNSSGNVQIDSTFKNLALREKGTLTSGGSEQGNTGWYFASVTTAVGTSPIIAFRSSAKCYLRYSAISGSQITYFFHCQGSGVAVQYWIFDDPSLATMSGNYGLQVFNNVGSVVFDSRTKYMRVIDTLSSPGSITGDPIDSGISRSYSGTPAVVQGQLRYIISNNAVGTPPNVSVISVLTVPAVSFSGGAVTWKADNPATTQFTGNVPEGQNHTPYDYMVLDVSGI
ncbi:hypothetical protein AWB80_03814 [Caballeronia pedi]|uniref:Uncharacterized protein n=1 Tax=Caballeronia pedi TaxID=1777141 RepID=A0A158BMV0_9BURK|nr:hypothetical protein [Caballeronia pedi]SAK71373.1 hypothetical protein AWB80_03814 [Caballeronia pedi]